MRKLENTLSAAKTAILLIAILLPVATAALTANPSQRVTKSGQVESNSSEAPTITPSERSTNIKDLASPNSKPTIQDAMMSLIPYFMNHRSLNYTGTTPTTGSPSMLATAPSSWANVKVGSDPSGAEQDEPSVAVNPINGSNVVVGMHNFAVSYNQPVSAYASFDGGYTWKGPFMMPVPVSGDYTSDPVVAFNRTGVAFFSYLSIRSNFATSDLVVSKSFDGGLTWSAPVVAVKGISGYSLVDKDYMAIGPSPTNSTLDNVYVTYSNFTGYNNVRIEFARSTDGGASWSESLPISPDVTYPRVVQGSMPAVSPTGIVYVAYYDSTSDGYLFGAHDEMIAISSDGGETFTAPITMAHMPKELPFTIWPTYFRAAPSFIPIITVGPEGNVYAVFASNPPGPDVSDIYFTRSTDGGNSWSLPVRVNDDGSTQSQFFPWIATEENGTIIIIYGDHRLDAHNWAYDVYDAISTDGGLTFDFNKRVTTVSGNPGYDNFIGDYFNLAVSNTTAYAVWTDERNYPAQNSDIYIGIGNLMTASTRTHDPGVPIADNTEPDNCTTARNAGNGGSFIGNTVYADDDFPENPYGGNGTTAGFQSPDVVYKFTATTTGNYVVNTFGSGNPYWYLEVRTVCENPNTRIASSYYYGSLLVLRNLSPGDYYVILDGAYRSWGPYVLNIRKLPPASLSANPASAATGTIISLAGQGFIPNSYFTVNLDGLRLTSGSVDTLGNLSMYLLLPELQPGVYPVSSTDSYGITASSSIAIYEISPLQIIVNTTTVFKQGRTAEFYVLASAKGIRVNANLTSAQLFGPGGSYVADILGNATRISTGLYHLAYQIPARATSGIYTLVVNASYITPTLVSTGSSLTVFNIGSPTVTLTGLQTVLASTTIVGVGVLALRRRHK